MVRPNPGACDIIAKRHLNDIIAAEKAKLVNPPTDSATELELICKIIQTEVCDIFKETSLEKATFDKISGWVLDWPQALDYGEQCSPLVWTKKITHLRRIAPERFVDLAIQISQLISGDSMVRAQVLTAVNSGIDDHVRDI